MFMNIKKINIVSMALVLILASSLFLRVYKIDSIPPSISWDEASVGYDAFSIANYGYDQWGNLLPLVFKSFEDDKNPIHVYFTAVSVKVLGLSDFSIRFPVAIFGVLNVLVIFFLARLMFSSNLVGLIAALFLGISPYSLQFSRFNHEANFALFFFVLGLFLFLKGIRSKNYLLSLSFLSFGASMLSYHAAKIVVPAMVILLMVLYLKDLWKIRKYFILGVILLSIVLSAFLLNPALIGKSRLKQTEIPKEKILNSDAYKSTQNEFLGLGQVVFERYMSHFTWQYLFVSGDKIPRHSSQGVGEFYKLDLIFLVVGLFYLLIRRSKISVVLLYWTLLAPIPAAISGGGSEVPHAARALYMMGSLHLIAAFGFYKIISIFKAVKIRLIVAGIFFIILSIQFKDYIIDYYTNYPIRYAIEWQYGMKQIGEFIQSNPNYSQINMTDIRHQPYIFFLYYQKTPLQNFINTVTYNTGESRSYNLVTFFDYYHFGDWDPVESMPNVGVLYILTPSQYDGLRHKALFEVKRLIKYPNGENAFFIVSAI